MHIHELLQATVENKASDLHLAAGEVPAIRLHGEIVRLNTPALGTDDAKRLVYALMSQRQRKAFEEHKEVDFSLGLRGISRFRVNVFEQRRGVAAVFRTIPDRVIPLEELGLPEAARKAAEFRRGLVLVTGPTGSGKSTTLAGLINYINENRREHILTIEDPIEFVHQHGKGCIINQREVNADTTPTSFVTRLCKLRSSRRIPT